MPPCFTLSSDSRLTDSSVLLRKLLPLYGVAIIQNQATIMDLDGLQMDGLTDDRH